MVWIDLKSAVNSILLQFLIIFLYMSRRFLEKQVWKGNFPFILVKQNKPVKGKKADKMQKPREHTKYIK